MVALHRRSGLRLGTHGRGALVCGALLSVGYCFQSAALHLISASRTAFLTALCVPLVPLLEACARSRSRFRSCL